MSVYAPICVSNFVLSHWYSSKRNKGLPGILYSVPLVYHVTGLSLSGIVLKMARVTKDVSSRGQKSNAESISKAPLKTLIIPAKELVQVIAKV